MKKNCVITGATSGIGRATAVKLAGMGFCLVLVGRCEVRGSRVLSEVRKLCPDQGHKFFSTDISDLDQVHSLADSILETCSTIDVLINNAGARFDEYGESKQGFELTFATNHLGHFLLTGLLLDSLSNAAAPRVVNVSSCARHSAKQMADWLLTRENYDRKRAYAQSKLANVLFSCELARRSEGAGLIANAVDPGVAATNFARNNGLIAWYKHLLSHRLRGDLRSAVSAARTVVFCATDQSIEGVTGRIFSNCAEVPLSSMETDKHAASELWDSSVQWNGLESARP